LLDSLIKTIESNCGAFEFLGQSDQPRILCGLRLLNL